MECHLSDPCLQTAREHTEFEGGKKNIWSFLQPMKATVLANFLPSNSVHSMAVSSHELGRCCPFLPFLFIFLYHFPGFPFTSYTCYVRLVTELMKVNCMGQIFQWDRSQEYVEEGRTEDWDYF